MGELLGKWRGNNFLFIALKKTKASTYFVCAQNSLFKLLNVNSDFNTISV